MSPTHEAEALVTIAAGLAGGWLPLSTCPPAMRRSLMQDALGLLRLAGEILDEHQRAAYGSTSITETEGVPC